MAHPTRFVRFNDFAIILDSKKSNQMPSENDSDEGICSLSEDSYSSDSPDYVNVVKNDEDLGEYVTMIHVTDTAHGSPFDVVCKVVEGVYARGKGLSEAYAGSETYFEVDTCAAPDRTLSAIIRNPDGYEITSEITDEDEDQYRVTYKPEETGIHVLTILYDGAPIEGSPYNISVMRPKVFVRDFNHVAHLGHKTSFKIDASQMVKGTLEIDSDLPILAYDKMGQNTYKVTYVPRKIGKHDLVIKYNNQVVEGCPFVVEVLKSKR